MSNAGVYAESGVFVCFEGGEGSGKSTQSGLLRDWLTGAGVRRTPHLRARRHRVGREAARDRAQPRDRRALRPHRGAAVRRRQVRARRHRRRSRARARRGRDHRPVRRLDAGLPGRRPGARRRRGRAGRPLGHPRPAPAPDRRARPRARARARPVRRARPDRGRVAGVPPAGPRRVPADGQGRPRPLPGARRPRRRRRDRRPGARARRAAARPRRSAR